MPEYLERLQLLTELIRPIANQRGGTGDDALFDSRLARFWRLLKQSPHERDTLESLAKAHLIGHDASVRILDDQAGRTSIQELNSKESAYSSDAVTEAARILTLTPST